VTSEPNALDIKNLAEHIEELRLDLASFDAAGAQALLAKTERDIATCERRAREHDTNAREYRSLFARMHRRKDWRACFANIEDMIRTNETEADEYRALAAANREAAEQTKLALAQHATMNQFINGGRSYQ
jgi:hypothetical protein